MTVRVEVVTPCEHDDYGGTHSVWDAPYVLHNRASTASWSTKSCPGGSRRTFTGWPPEAIEAAMEHTRQLNFWQGINDPVWSESEIREITEAALAAALDRITGKEADDER